MKRGKEVLLGHEKWDFMLSLMLGIGMCVYLLIICKYIFAAMSKFIPHEAKEKKGMLCMVSLC